MFFLLWFIAISITATFTNVSFSSHTDVYQFFRKAAYRLVLKIIMLKRPKHSICVQCDSVNVFVMSKSNQININFRTYSLSAGWRWWPRFQFPPTGGSHQSGGPWCGRKRSPACRCLPTTVRPGVSGRSEHIRTGMVKLWPWGHKRPVKF